MRFIGSLRTRKLPVTHRRAIAERRRLRFSFFPLTENEFALDLSDRALKQRQR
jgi:hypothetical protein